MNQLLDSLYNLLCYITEDATAHGFTSRIPKHIMDKMNELADEIANFLDKD